MVEVLLLVLILALIAANGVFVAAEFSLVTVDRSTVERAHREGDPRAEGVLAALTSLSTQLSGAQLGITVTSLAVGFLVEPALGGPLAAVLAASGLPSAAAVGVAATAALALATVVQMVFGELVPKNWAIARPLPVARQVATPQRVFSRVAGPMLRVLNGSANGLLRAVGIEPQEELRSARRPSELAAVAERSSREGVLDSATAEMLSRAVDFPVRTAADVMTPRTRVRFVDQHMTVAQLLDVVAETGHARFPVIGASFDEVLGVAHFKHALAVPPDERTSTTVRDVARPVPEVPATQPLEDLLDALREPGWQLAVVVDEYGGTAGIVTLEDLVEEIVGEIEDEQDEPGAGVQQLDDGSWLVPALLRPDELSRAVPLRLPEPERADTLAGLLQERLGAVPQVGDVVRVEAWDLAADEDVPTPTEVELTVTRQRARTTTELRLATVRSSEEPAGA
ncbi:MAG: hemolysin family protein [Actinomycetes bacterium]